MWWRWGRVADTLFSSDEVWAMLAVNDVLDGMTLTALLWYFARLGMRGYGLVHGMPSDQ